MAFLSSFLIVILLALPHVYVSSSAEYNLISELLRDYNTNVRPVRNWSEPIQLGMGFMLSKIISMDETAQVLRSKCWITLAWQDEFLAWQPSLHQNITHTTVPSGDIWRPDLVMYNNIGNTLLLDYSEDFKVHVDHQGSVRFRFPVIGESTCPIDIRYYPWDIQVCPFRFAMWTRHSLQINASILWAGSKGYKASSDWLLLGVTSRRREYIYNWCPDDRFPDLTFYVVVRRHPLTVLFSSAIPMVLVQGMALLAFYLSPANAEHISLGMAFLSAMMFFLWHVASISPSQCNHAPVLSVYLLISICVVTIGLFPSALITSLYVNASSECHRPPTWLRTLCLHWLARGLLLEGFVNSSLHIKKNMLSQLREYDATVPERMADTPVDSKSSENRKAKTLTTECLQKLCRIKKLLLRIQTRSRHTSNFTPETNLTLRRSACEANWLEMADGSSSMQPCDLFKVRRVESSQSDSRNSRADYCSQEREDPDEIAASTVMHSNLHQCLLSLRELREHADLAEQEELWYLEWQLIIHVLQRLLLVFFAVITAAMLLGLAILGFKHMYDLEENYEDDLRQELTDIIENA